MTALHYVSGDELKSESGDLSTVALSQGQRNIAINTCLSECMLQGGEYAYI